MLRANCGHIVDENYGGSYLGLCRRCQSNFAFVSDLELKYGEDALVQYWYSMILSKLSSEEELPQGANCLVSHLIEFYQGKLATNPSRGTYIRKMLYMLNSLRHPFDIEELK